MGPVEGRDNSPVNRALTINITTLIFCQYTPHTQHVIVSAWPRVLHNTGSQHVNTVSGSSSPPHMPPCPVCYSQQQPAFCSGEIDIESWTPDTWPGAAGSWLVLTPSVSNISTLSHVSLTSQIFLLTPDIFTAFTAFYNVARGSSSRCLLLLEGWHALLMALLVLNSWPLTIIARYQLSHCITFGHYCSNKAERLRDRRIHLDAR